MKAATSIALLCVLAVRALHMAPAAAQTPFCHRSGYSNIPDCKAANATKTVCAGVCGFLTGSVWLCYC